MTSQGVPHLGMAHPRSLLPGSLPVNGRLDVIEDREACFVVVEGDVHDWLVRFEKAEHSGAREWADNMADVYNLRRQASERALVADRTGDAGSRG